MNFWRRYPIRKFKTPPPLELGHAVLFTGSRNIVPGSVMLDIPTLVGSLSLEQRFQLKRALASPSRYYGDGGTIHSGGKVDVETLDGKVVSVWFRCQMLPFEQHEVDAIRAEHMDAAVAYARTTSITGVEVRDS